MTLPNIKWGLLYGVILCNARAMGEFGAVSVVSGPHPRPDQHHAAARGDPLQRVQFLGAFAVASLLALLALVTLAAQDAGRVEAAGQQSRTAMSNDV